MAEYESCVIPFPRQHSPLHESERSPLPSEAAEDTRAVMLGHLLDQLAEPEGVPPDGMHVRIVLDLLDEMVVLYRRAVPGV